MSDPPKRDGDEQKDGSTGPPRDGGGDAPAAPPSARSRSSMRRAVPVAYLPTLDAGSLRPSALAATMSGDSQQSLPESQKSAVSGSLTADLERGTTIGRYLITERLGAGGMGVVYAAYDPELDRKVAIKLLHTESWISDSTLGRVRLLREAQAMARLSHPNVIAVYDVGTFRDQVFVAMELVDGPTLADWLTAAPRTRSEILNLFIQAGRGLRAAHAAGLVHRDFKPENVPA